MLLVIRCGSLRRTLGDRSTNWSSDRLQRRLTPPSPGRGIRTAKRLGIAGVEGPIAQSEERRTRIAEVVGSNPIRSTMQVVNRFLAASAADHRT